MQSTCFKVLKMRLPGILSSAAAIAITCAVSAAAYYYRSRKTEINEVMIFCKLQYNVFNYFDKLLSFIEGAKRRVDVCMPSIHNPAIQGQLVELITRKNIKARIIIDKCGYNTWTAGFLQELAEAGAEIKWNSNNYKMQHKFCLVDEEVLMTGTLDWGNDLSFDNWNYVYITSKPQLVVPVRNEFNQMWKECSIRIEGEKPKDVESMKEETEIDCDKSSTAINSEETETANTTARQEESLETISDDELSNKSAESFDKLTDNIPGRVTPLIPLDL